MSRRKRSSAEFKREALKRANKEGVTDTQILAHPLVRHAIFARSFQRMSLELGTVSSVFLFCHDTPPDALSRTVKGDHQTGARPQNGR